MFQRKTPLGARAGLLDRSWAWGNDTPGQATMPDRVLLSASLGQTGHEAERRDWGEEGGKKGGGGGMDRRASFRWGRPRHLNRHNEGHDACVRQCLLDCDKGPSLSPFPSWLPLDSSGYRHKYARRVPTALGRRGLVTMLPTPGWLRRSAAELLRS